MRYMRCKSVRNRSVVKDTLLSRPKQLFVPNRLSLLSSDSKLTRGISSLSATTTDRSGDIVSEKGYSTLKAERVLHPYLASHCKGVTQTSQEPLRSYEQQPAQVWSKSGSNKQNFTPGAEAVFRPCFDPHCSRVTKISHEALSPY
jgi:hypothetical protein